jgi:hypothetical protein
MRTNLISFVEFHTNYFENVLYTLSHRLRKNNIINVISTVQIQTNNTHYAPGIYFNPPSNILRLDKTIYNREESQV